MSIDYLCLVDEGALLSNHFNVSSSKVDYILDAHIITSHEKQIALSKFPGLYSILLYLKQI